MHVGEFNTLRVSRFSPSGAYLNAQGPREVLLPNKFIIPGLQIGDEISVFLYTDSEDRLVATTEKPLIHRDSFAFLKVRQLSSPGAFMLCGLEKDLLVPFGEQRNRMELGESYLVYVYVDDQSNRLVGSTKYHRFLERATDELIQEGKQVDVWIDEVSDLGYSCVVEGKYAGLIYRNEVFTTLSPGQQLKAFVLKVRSDGKLDIRIQASGYESIDVFSQKILDELNHRSGQLSLSDSSSPEEIYLMLGMSKKNFKKAIGSLYKQKRIILLEGGIQLVQ